MNRADAQSMYQLLEKLNIPYRKVEHPEAGSMEELAEAEKQLGAVICKNLFLCNRQKTVFYLLLIRADKRFKTSVVSKLIGSSRLSFGEADKTKAVIGVHIFGQCCDAPAVAEICKKHDLAFIEDSAQAHGASWNGIKAGALGDMATFSFYPTKNMTTGEGGMVVTNDKALADVTRVLCNHGQTEKYLHTMLGYNYRMTNVHAAIGLEQLKRVDGFTAARQRNAKILSDGITAEGLTVPYVAPEAIHVYHQYVLRVEDSFPMTRDELMQYLADKGIGSAVHYPIPLHKQPYYADENKDVVLPVAEDAAKRVLSLPVHPAVTEEECRYIVDVINNIDM